MMLENFIGSPNFQKGPPQLPKKTRVLQCFHRRSLDALGSASRRPVRQMMDTWVRQVGYPIVDARAENSKVSLSQRRFLLEGTSAQKGRWIIPISVRTQKGLVTRLMKIPSKCPLREAGSKVNDGQKGFYRVRYDDHSLEELGALVEQKLISNLDRWSIHHDLAALVLANQHPIKDYLDFLRHYEEEDDYVVLSDIIGFLNFCLWSPRRRISGRK